MALTSVTVTGRFLLSDNETPAAGRITFKLSSPLQDPDGNIVAATPKRLTLDEDGAFTVVLVATDDVGITPAGATYLVTESIKHADQRSYSIELPHADTTVDLADVAPVSDVDLIRYVLASTFQAHLDESAAHTAAHVAFAPPEGMAATDVQAAIAELAADIAAVGVAGPHRYTLDNTVIPASGFAYAKMLWSSTLGVDDPLLDFTNPLRPIAKATGLFECHVQALFQADLTKTAELRLTLNVGGGSDAVEMLQDVPVGTGDFSDASVSMASSWSITEGNALTLEVHHQEVGDKAVRGYVFIIFTPAAT